MKKERRKLLDEVRSESQREASADARAAVEMIREEWPPNEVMSFVLVVPVVTGQGGWYSNFKHRAKLVEALESAIKSVKATVFEGDKEADRK